MFHHFSLLQKGPLETCRRVIGDAKWRVSNVVSRICRTFRDEKADASWIAVWKQKGDDLVTPLTVNDANGHSTLALHAPLAIRSSPYEKNGRGEGCLWVDEQRKNTMPTFTTELACHRPAGPTRRRPMAPLVVPPPHKTGKRAGVVDEEPVDWGGRASHGIYWGSPVACRWMPVACHWWLQSWTSQAAPWTTTSPPRSSAITTTATQLYSPPRSSAITTTATQLYRRTSNLPGCRSRSMEDKTRIHLAVDYHKHQCRTRTHLL
jgi:hypothetical protein